MRKIITIGDKYELFDGSNKVIIDSFGAKVLAFIEEDENRLFYNSNDISHSGIPLCFPNFGPLVNSKLVVDSEEYPMNQHGFIRDMDFELVEQSDTVLELKLKSTYETKTKYPFDFEFVVKFELQGNKLSINFQWKNLSNNKAPISPGVHPYFRVYDKKNIILQTRAINYNLSKDFSEVEEVIKSDYLDMFSENSFVIKGAPDINLINHNSEITKVDIGSKKFVEIIYNNKDFNRLTVWRKAPDTDYICIEPANAQNKINEAPYLIPHGDYWESEVSIVFN